MYGIHQRFLQVEQEGVTELIGLALIGRLTTHASERTDVPTKTIAFELVEDVLQSLLTNLANATSGQFPVVALLLDVARLLQHPHEFFQLLNRLVLLVA